MDKRGNASLIVLYSLLVIIACLFHQIQYSRLVRIILAATILFTILLWHYLYKKRIIHLSIFSNSLQKNLRENERRFLFGLFVLLLPVLKIWNITVSDIILSVLMVALTIGIRFMLKEH